MPQPNSTTRFSVSVVVCFNRNLTERRGKGGQRLTPLLLDQRRWAAAALRAARRPINDISGDSPGNIDQRKRLGCLVQHQRAVPLVSRGIGWGRKSQATDATSTLHWSAPIGHRRGRQAVALGQHVLGVYTATVDLDTDPTWKN